MKLTNVRLPLGFAPDTETHRHVVIEDIAEGQELSERQAIIILLSRIERRLARIERNTS